MTMMMITIIIRSIIIIIAVVLITVVLITGPSSSTSPYESKSVSHFVPSRLQERRVTRLSHFATDPKATRVLHFAGLPIQQQRESRISRAHDFKSHNKGLAFRGVEKTNSDQSLQFGDPTLPKPTKLLHFATSRIQKQRDSRMLHPHDCKRDVGDVQKTGWPNSLLCHSESRRATCHSEDSVLRHSKSVTRPRKHRDGRRSCVEMETLPQHAPQESCA